MIDLERTPEELLGDIGVSPRAGEILEPTDPRCLTLDVARLHLVGSSRDELFPLLEVILTQRFTTIPPSQLLRDLLAPLKNGLGNAYKHGNRRDRSKHIDVQVALGPSGAWIAVTDEGAGFNVEAKLQRFRDDSTYFENLGAGFRNFARSAALVSFTEGGRTFLLRFLAPTGDLGSSCTQPVPERPLPLSVDQIREALQDERPDLAGASLVLFGPRPDDPSSYRCVIRSVAETCVYTIQVLPSESAAALDFRLSEFLQPTLGSGKIRIPRPVALLAAQNVVISDFAPSMNLWTYLSDRGGTRGSTKMARRVGRLLRTLHTTTLPVDTEPRRVTLQRWSDAGERACRRLQPEDPTLATRLRGFLKRFRARATRFFGETPSERGPHVPVHGSLGWDCIHYGVNGRFYLSRLQSCRRAHAGLDLGAFLADLLIDCDRQDDLASYTRGSEALLDAYANGGHVEWFAALPLFVTGIMLERIAALPDPRMGQKDAPEWTMTIDPLRVAARCLSSLDAE